MKYIFLLVFFLPYVPANAQQPSPAVAYPIFPSEISPQGNDSARIRSLEEQVHTLVEQVTLLRAEMESMRHATAPVAPKANQTLLAAAHLEPGMILTAANPPAGPPPPPVEPVSAEPAQVAQTQTYGGATSNAKLLNPDISLIGDFIGTAGHNDISPSKSLEMHESDVGMQAIVDPYARADH